MLNRPIFVFSSMFGRCLKWIETNSAENSILTAKLQTKVRSVKHSVLPHKTNLLSTNEKIFQTFLIPDIERSRALHSITSAACAQQKMCCVQISCTDKRIKSLSRANYDVATWLKQQSGGLKLWFLGQTMIPTKIWEFSFIVGADMDKCCWKHDSGTFPINMKQVGNFLHY